MTHLSRTLLLGLLCCGLTSSAYAGPNQNRSRGSITIEAPTGKQEVLVGSQRLTNLVRAVHTRDVSRPGRPGPHMIELEMALPIRSDIRVLWDAAQKGTPSKTNITMRYTHNAHISCLNVYTGCAPTRQAMSFTPADGNPRATYRWQCAGEIRVGGPKAKPSCG